MSNESSKDTHTTQYLGYTEFVILMASLTSTVAMSIDMVLPALGIIGDDFQLTNPNDNQLMVGTLFAGLAIGQFIYGPLSDSLGRKPVVYIGSIIAIIGTLLCLFSSTFVVMLIGRALQGFGGASARTIVVAIIRDRYSGAKMAQVMSIVMTIFIIVPAIAPAVGLLLISLFHWRSIFVLFLLVLLINFLWFAFRQPETLRDTYRSKLRVSALLAAAAEVCANRYSFGYTLVSGLVFGAFLGYLSSTRQIFQDIYMIGGHFAFYFAALALSFGVASLLNAKLVSFFAIKTIIFTSLLIILLASLVSLVIVLNQENYYVSLPFFLTFCAINFFCLGMCYGNLNTLAMAPMQRIAGTASAIIGGLSAAISIAIGGMIGQLYNGTIMPLLIGYTLSGAASLALAFWIDKSGFTFHRIHKK